MTMIDIFYHDIFPIPLPEKHRFPITKYPRLREKVTAANLGNLHIGQRITDDDLLRVHAADYIHRVENGLLTRQEQRRTGFPSSPSQAERARHSCGSTVDATYSALRNGRALNLGGGTHHAHHDWGQGFSVYNDVVVAAKAVQAAGLVERVLVVDLDVHQGNGTAALTQNDPSIFTFSMHGAKNFPFKKEESDLDIGLANGTADNEYLDLLDEALWRIPAQFDPELVLYIAGADPWIGDKLGKLSLTKAGLIARDERIVAWCVERGLPLSVCMGGGYAKDVTDSIDIMFNTVKTVCNS